MYIPINIGTLAAQKRFSSKN